MGKKKVPHNAPTADQQIAQLNAALESAFNSSEIRRLLSDMMRGVPPNMSSGATKPRRKQRRDHRHDVQQ